MIVYAVKSMLTEHFVSHNGDFKNFGTQTKLYKSSINATKKMNKITDEALTNRFYNYCRIEGVDASMDKLNQYVLSHRKDFKLEVVKIEIKEVQ